MLQILKVLSKMIFKASPSFVVVDLHCRIRYASPGSDLKRIMINRARLQPDVEAFVGGLTAAERDEAPSPARCTFLDDDCMLRVVRVIGDEGTVFILSLEENSNRSNLTRAARRHELTRRETEVLALILDGSNAGEIAQMLAISEHTVQGYFKRLLHKTGARNRVSMVAGVLDWNSQTAANLLPASERLPSQTRTAV